MTHSYLVFQGKKSQRRKKVRQIILKKIGEKKINLPSPDVFNIKGETSIKISQIRQLKHLVQRKPYKLPKKFAVLWEAEKLTIPAQNSLLKLLEEPPQNTIIILSCQNEGLLLPTIVSRCQMIRLSRKEKTDDKEVLSKSFPLLRKIINGKIKERFQEAEALSQEREKTVEFLSASILIFRELIHQQLAAKRTSPFSKSSLKKLTTKQLLAQMKSFQKTRNLIKKNVNARLALENLFLKIPNLI